MGMFAIGTTPGLLSIGGLTSVVKGVFAQRFFRVVGVVVVAMAFINISNGYNLLGISRAFSGSGSTSNTTAVTQQTAPEEAKADLEPVTLATTFRLDTDIVPSSFTTKVGQKTTIEVDVKEDGQGCMSTIMIPGLSEKPQYLKSGKKITMTFTPKKAGTYQITCAMGIPRGTLKVEG